MKVAVCECHLGWMVFLTISIIPHILGHYLHSFAGDWTQEIQTTGKVAFIPLIKWYSIWKLYDNYIFIKEDQSQGIFGYLKEIISH